MASSMLKTRTRTRTRTSPGADEPYVCGICFQIMHEPCFLTVDSCGCQRSHCRKCLEKWSSERDSCPSCNARFIEPPSIISCCRQWGDFCDGVLRHCPHVDGGSCKKFKVGDYDDLSKHLLVCPHQRVRCDNEECGQMIKRSDMKDHVRLCRLKRCSKFIGEYEGDLYGCGFMGSRAEVAQHESKCAFSTESLNQIKKLKQILEKNIFS